ncbi:MAG: YfcE family phosphodiesterase [Candidatus Hermodarchaeota archaeon]
MTKLLVIGDTHVPKRASKVSDLIQTKLKELIELELFECTFFTGDEVEYPEFMELLRLITKRDVYRVIGNMDFYYGNRDAPLYQEKVINFNGEKLIIGLTHGAQIEPRGDKTQLELLAAEKNCNILISGHTHKEEVYVSKKGILLLNPGSVTGAWSFVASRIPSFIVLSIDKETKDIEVSLFQLDKISEIVNENKYYFLFEKNKILNKS